LKISGILLRPDRLWFPLLLVKQTLGEPATGGQHPDKGRTNPGHRPDTDRTNPGQRTMTIIPRGIFSPLRSLPRTFGHFNISALESQKPSAISKISIRDLKNARHFNFPVPKF
jgi:hypothetical protein